MTPLTPEQRAACVISAYLIYCPLCAAELPPLPDMSNPLHRQCHKCERCLHCQIHIWLKLDAQARRS